MEIQERIERLQEELGSLLQAGAEGSSSPAVAVATAHSEGSRGRGRKAATAASERNTKRREPGRIH